MQLARQANPQLRKATAPYLRQLAEEFEVTSQCVVAEGEDAVVLAVVEPPASVFHLSQHSGARNPLDQGASGLAILMSRRASAGDPPAVREARRAGYAVSHGRLTAGAVGVAVPLYDGEGNPLDAAIGIVSMVDVDVDVVAGRLVEFSRLIAREGV
jgi:DNA-binding IclR family transcriptional regulator